MSKSRPKVRGGVKFTVYGPGANLRFNENTENKIYNLIREQRRVAGGVCFDHLNHIPYA